MENSIAIKQMTLLNFKGIRNKKIEFEHVTNIFGDNGTGKTTLFDAFTWLLFGKDSTDRQVFEIKTLDKNNNVIPKIDHEVSATLIVSGELIEIKRVLREKWVKRKGSLESEFSGHETQYYWNDVPKNQKEYQDKVTSILAESVFKLITNPLAFNSLKWTERRSVLIELVGDVKDEDVASGNIEFEALMSKLTNKSLDEYKKQLASQRKKLNDELKMIPTRIDEVIRNTPEALNFDSLKNQKSELEKNLGSIENQINDESKAYDELSKKRATLSKEIYELQGKIQDIESNTINEINNSFKKGPSEKDKLSNELRKANDELESFVSGVKSLKLKREELEIEIESITKKMNETREEWHKVNGETLDFKEDDLCCPTCKREFDENQMESKKAEMMERFKSLKKSKLDTINKRGSSLKGQKEHQESEIKKLDERISNGNEKVKESTLNADNLISKLEHLKDDKVEETPNTEELYKKSLRDNKEYQELLSQVSNKEKSKDELKLESNTELNEKKSSLKSQIQSLESQINIENQIAASNKRREELESQESKLAQEISNLEKEEFVIENFEKEKANQLENKVNRKFRLVKFKLFETQINGAEVPCCHTLINGVPFSDANTASKINAGLDIINTLCKYYQITAPIFIDNRESVVDIIPSESQLINLIVSEPDKKLRVEFTQQEAALI